MKKFARSSDSTLINEFCQREARFIVAPVIRNDDITIVYYGKKKFLHEYGHILMHVCKNDQTSSFKEDLRINH